MAASIKLCQPSVLWQQSLNFSVFPPIFPPSDTQNDKMDLKCFLFFFPLSVTGDKRYKQRRLRRENRALMQEKRSGKTPPQGIL